MMIAKITVMDLCKYNTGILKDVVMHIHRGGRIQFYSGNTNARAARMLNLFLAYLRKCGNYPK